MEILAPEKNIYRQMGTRPRRPPGSRDGDASARPGPHALLDVVGPGRNAGYWNPVSPGAEGRAVVPVGHAGPRRLLNAGAGYLGDGTFPGC